MNSNQRERIAYYIMGVAIGCMLLGIAKLAFTASQRRSGGTLPATPSQAP